MLLPALAKSKEEGLRASCESNLHQIGAANVMYADDNKQILAMAGDPSYPEMVERCGGVYERPRTYVRW